jgi:hypothetical protein
MSRLTDSSRDSRDCNRVIKTISYSQSDTLKNIQLLYLENKNFECDVTYSKGAFYKDIEEPKFKFDILPQTTDTIKADCLDLPIKNNMLESLMFDPPFLATTGKSLSSISSNNIITKRFGCYKNETELFEFYKESLKEFYRVLKVNGILVVKIQDKVSSGKQYLSHVFIINEAEKLGFYAEDIFILLAKSRLVAEWQKNQKHARKFHSYFIVFRKCNKKIKKLKELNTDEALDKLKNN